jgi:glycosyltransferase involved in cell wall biosynthesis
MIRVLHVIATLDPAGAERQLSALCCRLDRAEFQPRVCCLTRGGPLERDLSEADVAVTVLGKRGRYDARVFWRLRAAIRDFRPDIAHTWLFTSNLWGRLAAVFCRTPVIIASERAADVWKTAAHRFVDRLLARHSACILANAEAVRRFCVDGIGLPGDKVRVIRNGLDLGRFDSEVAAGPVPPLPPADDRPVIGVVARLEEQKGLAYLIEALARLHAAGVRPRLWVVGDGPLRPHLESLAWRAGVLPEVLFLGRRPDVPALLGRMDVVALPSLWEGLPNVLIEAMAASRCVAATAVDGAPEVVADGETGLLVPPRDPDALAAALGRLLADSDLRRRMGEAGRRRVEREFPMRRMVDETAALYRELKAKADAEAKSAGRETD